MQIKKESNLPKGRSGTNDSQRLLALEVSADSCSFPPAGRLSECSWFRKVVVEYIQLITTKQA